MYIYTSEFAHTIYPIIQNIGFYFYAVLCFTVCNKQLQATRAIKHCSCIFTTFTELYLMQSSQFIIQSHGKSLVTLFFFIYIKCLIEVRDFSAMIKNNSNIFL